MDGDVSVPGSLHPGDDASLGGLFHDVPVVDAVLCAQHYSVLGTDLDVLHQFRRFLSLQSIV